MRVIFGALALAVSFCLLNLSWAGQDPKQDKKDEKKEKAHDVGKGLELKGNLDNSLNMTYEAPDAKEGNKKKRAHQVFLINLVKGKSYQFDMTKDEDSGMIPYLFVEDAKKKVLDEASSDAGTSQLIFKAPEDGVYRIIGTTLGGAGQGDFVLKVSEKK